MPRNRSPDRPPTPDQADWKAPRIGVCPALPDEQLRARVRALSAELNLPTVAKDSGGCDLLLVVTDGGLQLCETGRGAAGAVTVDFTVGGQNTRRLATVSRRQPLALAVGMKKGNRIVLDATAGLGRDALALASLGCTVIAVERSAILGAMLRDALERAAAVPAAAEMMRGELTVIIGDATEILSDMSAQEAPDVIYLDPMYEPSGKSALPKKEMRILRRLVGDDSDAASLLEAARRVARDRVVVKRTPRAAALGSAPTMSYRRKLVRYDVYLAPS